MTYRDSLNPKQQALQAQIFDTCVMNLRNSKNLSSEQKKSYMHYLLNHDFHDRNTKSLEEESYDKILLRASFKYAKKINREGKITDPLNILQWIYSNKNKFLNKIPEEDLKVIGPAEELYHKIASDEPYEIKSIDQTHSDYQIFNYYSTTENKEKTDDFIIKLIEDINSNQKSIKSARLLESLCIYLIPTNFSDSTNSFEYEKIFFFFRLYAAHQIEKQKCIQESIFNNFVKLVDYIINAKNIFISSQKEEMCKFLAFYEFELFNFLPNGFSIKLQPRIEQLIEYLYSLDDTKDDKANTILLFLYGLYKYKKGQKLDSEAYFSAASQKGYHKASYFLAEILKETEPERTLELYKQIIEYKDDKGLNQDSDLLERACSLYQYGLVFAEGLYSTPINWEEADKYWKDPISNLCITNFKDIRRFQYIKDDYPNLLFMKYKADRGLMEAQHQYFKICSGLKKEKDILTIYMHDLCLFSNYDPKYIDEMKEYARRLDVGEGVEKDKKKSKMIQDKIKQAKKI